ncbi:hypothetical protein ACFWFI_36700 [Streptomyces sp. NPDC060209]|uniref:hypothetical protein n=1 Tax=Streptomyces sp. NPDC060209 TaxID=3347073 RepID=UPI003659933F
MSSLRAARRQSLLGAALTTAGLLLALSGSALAVPVESANAAAARYGSAPAASVALPLAGPAMGDSAAEGEAQETEVRTVVDIPRGRHGGRRGVESGLLDVRKAATGAARPADDVTPALFVSVRVDDGVEKGRRALDDYARAAYGPPLEELEKIPITT